MAMQDGHKVTRRQKDPFVCPKDPGLRIPNQSYDLGDGMSLDHQSYEFSGPMTRRFSGFFKPEAIGSTTSPWN